MRDRSLIYKNKNQTKNELNIFFMANQISTKTKKSSIKKKQFQKQLIGVLQKKIIIAITPT